MSEFEKKKFFEIKVRAEGVHIEETPGEEFASLLIEKKALDLWDFQGITDSLEGADFFKEIRRLCKDELNEGDSVCPVVLAKLKLLEAAKELKLGIPYLTAKGYIEFAKARFELDEEETETLRSVIQAANERRIKAKMGGGA